MSKICSIIGIVWLSFIAHIAVGQIPDPPKNFLSVIKNRTLNVPSDYYKILALTDQIYFNLNHLVSQDTGNTEDDFSPVVEVLGDSIYVVWNGDQSSQAIYFSRSMDGGNTFTNPIRINDSVLYPPSFSVFQPDIKIDAQGHIWVVWHDYRFWNNDADFNNPIEIFLDRSFDGGLSWGADTQVTSGAGSFPWHFQPYLAVDQLRGILYVSFTDYDRYTGVDLGDVSLVASIDSGQSFCPKIRVDDLGPTSLVSQLFSDIAVDPNTGKVFVVFEDDRNGDKDIYIAVSQDTAKTIVSNLQVNLVNTGIQEEPAIALDTANGLIYVAWKDWRQDEFPDSLPYLNHIYASQSSDTAQSFSAGVQVTDVNMQAAFGFNFPPDLAVTPTGDLFVVWHDSREGFSNVYYDQALGGTLTFGRDLRINNNQDTITHALPRITTTSTGQSVIVWLDDRNENGDSHGDIFLGGSLLENCKANEMLSGIINSGNYQAGITLQSSGQVLIGSNVTMTSGLEIDLLPNFSVTNNAQLIIEIAGCSDP